MLLKSIYNTQKREPTAIGSFGLPHPRSPIYAESPRKYVSVSPICGKPFFKLW